ncbi:hypothetical protein UFOVP190_55 [uncultured Caudovirales phage]|uniref:Uncharacterized protein n=1 Tax=uncultured Caudovirales phage TaxID=2100421 RepID=A0A6J7WK47_9CAUD|nr:hypothetical protein UFOVP190_55 [uncultured Caudovirales phage]
MINTDNDRSKNANLNKIEENAVENTMKKPDENSGIYVRGHIKIFDPKSGEVYIDKPNAIHYENFSVALANSIGNKGQNFIYEMTFGNGGTSVDTTGIITYLPTNTVGQNASLYNPTYSKIVDNTAIANADPSNNKITITHIPGTVYTDILISCLLDYGEPSGQALFDNSQNLNSEYVFDELGLRGRSTDGTSGLLSTGLLLTHVVFHPVQKALNRLIQIDYTVRVQTLTNLSSIG